MTGFGSGEARQGDVRFQVELSSVNRKQLDISLSCPRACEGWEPMIRRLVSQRVGRGRVTIKVYVEFGGAPLTFEPQINIDLARAYIACYQKLGEALGRPTDGTPIEHIAKLPGVLETREREVLDEGLEAVLEEALHSALDGLVRSREIEGAALADELELRIANLAQSAHVVEERSAALTPLFRERLLDRLKSAGLEVDLDDERVLKELVLFADRSDITEEVTRLRSHFLQFQEYLAADEPAGRALDFLAQEMYREINTIGSKANDSIISQEVVTLKTELEKFREQAQNIE